MYCLYQLFILANIKSVIYKNINKWIYLKPKMKIYYVFFNTIYCV